MSKPRRPAWWRLYALVPLMGGLLMLESYAPLSPGWHECVQIGIVLFVFGLVWVWVRANAVALLEVGYDTNDRETVQETNGMTIRSSRPRLAGSRVHVRQMRARGITRAGKAKANGREIRKCSHNLGRHSHRWRS